MTTLQRLYPGEAAALTIAVQVAAVVALAALLARALARRSPAALYGVWLCALVCLPVGALAVWGFQQSGAALIRLPWLQAESATEDAAESETQAAAALSVAGGSADAADPHRQSAWQRLTTAAGAAGRWCLAADRLRAGFVLLELAWAVGAAYFAARLLWGLRTLALVRRELTPVDARRLGDLPERVQRKLGMRRFPAVMTWPRLRSPVSLGILRPTIVLPAELLAGLNARQLHDVLVHECAHFLRRDHLTGLWERLVQIVFWPHPAIYLLRRELARAREELCDNYVLCGGDSPHYARTLLEISQRAGGRTASCWSAIGFLHAPRRLEVRVAGLLDKRRSLLTRINGAALAALAMAFLLAAGLIAGTRLVPAEPTPPVQVASAAPSPPVEPDPRPVAPAEAVPWDALQLAAWLAAQPPRDDPPSRSPAAPTPAAPPQQPPQQDAHAPVATTTAAPAAPPAPQPAETVPSQPRLPALAAAPARLFAARSVVDLSGLVEPAIRVEREEGQYMVSLRVGEHLPPKFAAEPGKARKLTYQESSHEFVAFEVLIHQGPSPEVVSVSYRLTVQLAPEAMGQWESLGAPCRLGQWCLLAPRGAIAAGLGVNGAQPAPSGNAATNVPATAARVGAIRRLLSAALQVAAPDPSTESTE
jgi:beta-lactamase regulating signal transducer with metallopeptidase domain